MHRSANRRDEYIGEADAGSDSEPEPSPLSQVANIDGDWNDCLDDYAGGDEAEGC